MVGLVGCLRLLLQLLLLLLLRYFVTEHLVGVDSVIYCPSERPLSASASVICEG